MIKILNDLIILIVTSLPDIFPCNLINLSLIFEHLINFLFVLFQAIKLENC